MQPWNILCGYCVSVIRQPSVVCERNPEQLKELLIHVDVIASQ